MGGYGFGGCVTGGYVSQNVLELCDFTIALRFSGNQA